MKKSTAAKAAVAGIMTSLALFIATPALANWPGYYNYIGSGDGDIVAGRKDSYGSSNAYNNFESGSQAGSVVFWVDHNGAAKTAQYTMTRGTQRMLPYKDSSWSGSAMLRAHLSAWFSGEEMVRGSVNFDS